jgi:hypothetical protein
MEHQQCLPIQVKCKMQILVSKNTSQLFGLCSVESILYKKKSLEIYHRLQMCNGNRILPNMEWRTFEM